MPVPGRSEPKPLADKLEEDIQPLAGDEIEDEFLISNLTSKAHEIINNISSMIMKTNFKDIYKHPIDHERFLNEWDWEDEDIWESTPNDENSPHLNDSEETISSPSPTSSSGSYCSSNNDTSNDSSTLTDSDSSIPPPPPNSPEEGAHIPNHRQQIQALTNSLNDVVQRLTQFNSSHPTLPSHPRRSQRDVDRPTTYKYEGRAYARNRKK